MLVDRSFIVDLPWTNHAEKAINHVLWLIGLLGEWLIHVLDPCVLPISTYLKLMSHGVQGIGKQLGGYTTYIYYTILDLYPPNLIWLDRRPFEHVDQPSLISESAMWVLFAILLVADCRPVGVPVGLVSWRFNLVACLILLKGEMWNVKFGINKISPDLHGFDLSLNFKKPSRKSLFGCHVLTAFQPDFNSMCVYVFRCWNM